MSWIGRLLLVLAANALALFVASRLFGGVRIHGASAYVIGAAALGFANAFLKPVLTILTLPLVLVTLGFFYLVINIGMVAFAAWVAPHFRVHGFWTYVGTVVVIWLVNWTVESAAVRALER
jgi:putative membrane protein